VEGVRAVPGGSGTGRLFTPFARGDTRSLKRLARIRIVRIQAEGEAQFRPRLLVASHLPVKQAEAAMRQR
jgi:hypothetical protein